MAQKRILLAQDNPGSLQFEKKAIRKEAKRLGLDVRITDYDLRDPYDGLLGKLKTGELWFDWSVTDLLIDQVEDRPDESTGLRLLAELRVHGLLGGYKPWPAGPHRGIRCVAVYSVCVGDQHVPRSQPKLDETLRELGIDYRYLAPAGKMHNLAKLICERLAQERPAPGAQPS